MRFRADLAKVFTDFWRAKGTFARLGMVPVRRLILIALAVVGVTLGGYYMLRYKPTVSALWDMHDVQGYLSWRESLGLDDKQKSITEFSGKMKRIASLLEATGKAGEEVTELTKKAEKCGVEFVTVTPMTAQDSDGYVTRAVSLTVCASYMDLARFIRSLEESEKFINVVAVNVMAKGNRAATRSGDSRSHSGHAESGDGEEKLHVMLTIELYQEGSAKRKEKKAVGG